MLRNRTLPWNSLFKGCAMCQLTLPQKNLVIFKVSKLQSLPQMIILLQWPQAGYPAMAPQHQSAPAPSWSWCPPEWLTVPILS